MTDDAFMALAYPDTVTRRAGSGTWIDPGSGMIHYTPGHPRYPDSDDELYDRMSAAFEATLEADEEETP